jgi:hypothetical protein
VERHRVVPTQPARIVRTQLGLHHGSSANARHATWWATSKTQSSGTPREDGHPERSSSYGGCTLETGRWQVAFLETSMTGIGRVRVYVEIVVS